MGLPMQIYKGQRFNRFKNTTGAVLKHRSFVATGLPVHAYGLVVASSSEVPGDARAHALQKSDVEPDQYATLQLGGYILVEKKSNADVAVFGGPGTIDIATGQYDPAGADDIGPVIEDRGKEGVVIWLNEADDSTSTR